MANALTILRIVLSLGLLASSALSPGFFVLYALAGISDMVDGFVARKMGTESELGAILDSIADLVLAVVCLVKILPAVLVPVWLWLWVLVIVLIKVANVISGLVVEKRLVMLHTTAGKVAGFLAFLVPFAIPWLGLALPAIPACVVATFAALQEGHFIRTGVARGGVC